MYSNEELNRAVKANILERKSVEEFRTFIDNHRSTSKVDEENFTLFRGFNDIFVVIASFLLLLSLYWITSSIDATLSSATVVLCTWILSELFVRQRKMSFPAIVLLLIFSFALFLGLINVFEQTFGLDSPQASMFASLITMIAVFLHWKRFRVPITVALAMGTFLIFVLTLLLSISEKVEDFLVILVFIAGLSSFTLAMRWDSMDTQRLTSNTDIAFWLHLLASPLIVHSTFVMLGVFSEGENGMGTIISIIVLYLFLSFVSLAIDRRILMLSSMFYVLYAFNALFDSYGAIDNTFASAGIVLAVYLLVLSLFWHQVRSVVVTILPTSLRSKVP
jgi:hypothetical protein